MSLEDINAGAAAPAESGPVPGAGDGGVAASPAPAETPAAREEALDASLMAVWDKLNPTRTESGQFAGKEGEEPPATDKAAPASPDAPAKEAPEPAAKPAIEAPNSWSGEMKAKWATLPPEVQTYVSQREGEAHGAITRLGEQVKQFEPVGRVLQHHQAAFEKYGLSHQEGVDRLLDANAKLEADPVQGLITLGARYGIDLQPFFSAQPANGQVPRPDPMVRQLASKVDRIEGQAAARERAEAESRQSALQASVAEFAKGKPHFEAVKTVMGSLMTSGVATTLDQAYDMAVHADPAIRSRVLEDARKADAEKQAADDRAKAEKAKRAGGVNVRGAPASASPKSVDAALDEIARKHYG